MALFRASRPDRKPPASSSTAHVDISGRPIPAVMKRSARARRFILRIDGSGKGVVITVPMRASFKGALDFARSQEAWISRRLAQVPQAFHFIEGARLPVRGKEHVIVRHSRGERPAGAPEDGVIRIACEAPHLERRVVEWLKAEARKDLLVSSHAHAKRLGVKVRRVTLRDPSSRWGSCSVDGALSFSWRLILAPSFVLNYVAAHEVAHLKEMNHGPHFWALCRKLCPHMDEAKAWLKRHGSQLHAIDFD